MQTRAPGRALLLGGSAVTRLVIADALLDLLSERGGQLIRGLLERVGASVEFSSICKAPEMR